jgi:hypothetical protein
MPLISSLILVHRAAGIWGAQLYFGSAIALMPQNHCEVMPMTEDELLQLIAQIEADRDYWECCGHY